MFDCVTMAMRIHFSVQSMSIRHDRALLVMAYRSATVSMTIVEQSDDEVLTTLTEFLTGARCCDSLIPPSQLRMPRIPVYPQVAPFVLGNVVKREC